MTPDYTDLITPYHRSRPKFTETVRRLTERLISVRDLLASLPAAFDLDQAVGVQLDAVGERVGRSRFLSLPVSVPYLTWDGDDTHGWDNAYWRGPFSTTYGLVRLDDEPYRLLLRAQIAANHWDGTVGGMIAALDYVIDFEGGPDYYFEDRGDGSMVIGVAGTLPDDLTLTLLTRVLPLKSGGVRVYNVVTTVPETPVFGFDVSNEYISGFDEGSWGADVRTVLED